MDYGRLEYLAPLKIDLFQAALEFTKERVIGAARLLNHALEAFMKFLEKVTVKNSELKDLDAITYELLFAFKKTYQNSDKPLKSVNSHLGTFFKFLREQELGIRIPTISRDAESPREPLQENTLNQLVSNLREEVRHARSRQRIVDKALKTGREIKFDKSVYHPSYSLENICYWYRHELNEKQLNSSDKEYYALRTQIKKCNDSRVLDLSPLDFVETYHSDDWRALAATGKDPKGDNFHKTRYRLDDVLVTMANHPDWVLCEKRFETWSLDSLDNAWEAICFRITRSTHSSASIDPIVIEGFSGGLRELKGIIFPSLTEAITTFTFIGIQTGWNPEVIARIDRLNPEHSLSRSIDPDKVLLTSTKQRSQNSTKKKVLVEKEICAPSNLGDKYSAVNLLNLYIERSEFLRESISVKKTIDRSDLTNPVFVYCAQNTGGILKPGLNNGSYRALSRKIEEFDIALDDGTSLSALDLNKLRPTWLETQISHGVDESFLSLLMGHSDEETTEVHYNSHSRARGRRKSRLRIELNGIVEDLGSSTFKGYISRFTASEIQEHALREGHVFTDAKNKMICICLDSSSPTWPGSQRILTPGEQCTYLTKCTQCKQCVIARDTLPYLVDRQQYITSQSSTMSQAEFETLYGKEKLAIESVLTLWPDPEHVEDAMIIVSTEGPLLPSDLVIPELNLNAE